MARRSYLHLEEPDEPGLDIAPLIDVSFLLLCYFMVTSTMQRKENILDLLFPAKQTEQVDVIIEPLNIRLREDGVILAGLKGLEEELETNVNSRKCPRLAEKLREAKAAAELGGKTPLVVVETEGGAKHQRFIDIVNTLSIVEIANVTIGGFEEE